MNRKLHMVIDAVNFDFYGTIVDWLDVWVTAAAVIVQEQQLSMPAQDLALEWRREQRRIFEQPAFIPFADTIRAACDAMCRKRGIATRSYEDLIGRGIKAMREFPEVPDTLRLLRSRVRMGICSNSSREFFEHAARDLPPVVDAVTLSDDVGVAKPHRAIYEEAIRALSVPRERILHVASSQMDVRGATNAGLTVCWINRLGETLSPETPRPAFEICRLDLLPQIIGVAR